MNFSATELQRALDRDELLILYQAQVDLRDARLVGAECAIRWQHPERGLLHAVPFVDDVPPSGLAPAFMRFIVRTTTCQIAAWDREGIRVPRFAVNAWPASIGDELRDDILRLTREAGLDPSRLEVESQPEATYDPPMCARLQAFRDAGIRVALDDFGDGDIRYAWLRDAPFDVVKLGVSFGKRAGGRYADAVLSAGIAFAKAIGAETVIEGVETVAIRDRLRELGADHGQGYLWSQQVRAEEFPATLRAIHVDGSGLS